MVAALNNAGEEVENVLTNWICSSHVVMCLESANGSDMASDSVMIWKVSANIASDRNAI